MKILIQWKLFFFFDKNIFLEKFGKFFDEISVLTKTYLHLYKKIQCANMSFKSNYDKKGHLKVKNIHY